MPFIINEDQKVNREGWLWLAPEYFNQWRVFPRAFIIFYFSLCSKTAYWFMSLEDPTASQAAFASAIISAGAAWFGLYVNSGPNNKVYMSSSAPMTTRGYNTTDTVAEPYVLRNESSRRVDSRYEDIYEPDTQPTTRTARRRPSGLEPDDEYGS